MKRSLHFIRLIIINVSLMLAVTTAYGQTTYVWNNATSDFALSSNWTPARTTPATNDILVFDNGRHLYLNRSYHANDRKVQVTGNTKVTLQASSASTITIAEEALTLIFQ